MSSQKTRFISYDELIKYKGVPYDKSSIYIFDIDYTLYDFSMKIQSKFIFKLKEYLKSKHKLTEDDLLDLYEEYKSTVRGAYLKYNLSEDEVLNIWKSVNIKNILQVDFSLNELLKKIPHDSICMTNAMGFQAKEILKILQMENFFSFVVHSNYFAKTFIMKPNKEAFIAIEKGLQLDNTKKYFFDDRLNNIVAAQNFGWKTFLIDEKNSVKSFLRVHFSKI